MNFRSVWLFASVILGPMAHSALQAQEADADLTDEILVFGRAIDLVGAADSASEGIVGYDDLTTRPLLRVGELVEVIPGMIATQHSGGGKANQFTRWSHANSDCDCVTSSDYWNERMISSRLSQ